MIKLLGITSMAPPMIRSEDVRGKLRPMINGLFHKLEAIAPNVVILTPKYV